MQFSTNRLLNSENIFKRLSSYDIFRAYCTNFQRVGQSFISDLPLRAKKDTSPSCQIEYVGGDLLYTDFGEGSYRALNYVMRKFNLEFKDALSKINADFGLGLIDNFKHGNIIPSAVYKPSKLQPRLAEKSTSIIKVKYKDFTQEDIQYWEQFGWTVDMLNRASIRSISDYWLTMAHKGIYDIHYIVNELAYSFDYYRHEDIFRRKIYFPERKDYKRFISNVDNTIIQNWDLLPKNGGDILFITSSKKDTAPFFRVYNELKTYKQWNSIAPNNERTFLDEEVYWTKIKPRWKRIIAYLDNDETGIQNALIWAKKYNLEPMWNPIGFSKDPADWVRDYGLREFNWMLQNKLQQ